MSLVTLIRDYVDVANSTNKLDGYTLSSLAYHTIIFLFTVVKQAVIYCLTFHWLRDFSYFCFTPPLILSSFTNVGEFGNFIGVENQPLSHLLAFSDFNLSTGVGLIFLGFFNGCFSCMHFSAAHLVTIRRMLVQGVPAGLASAFGTAIGQFIFLICIFCGFRGLLLPWLALEPLQILVGTGIILAVASNMAQDRRTPTIQWSAKNSLFIYASINAALAWCEQAAIFQWMGNFSLGAEPTFLETAPFLGEPPTLGFEMVQQLIQNVSYLFAFLGGSVIGASLIAFLLQRFFELVLRYKKIAVYYGLVKQANLPLATLIFAFGFGSMPYYGFDYLVTKGFGFIPQEQFFKQTLFSPINLVSKTSQAKDSSQSRLEDQLALFFTLEGERSKSFAVDTTPFDNGQYLKTNQKRPQTFEDLNYRGEHLWTNRLSRISNIREQANQTQSSFLGPVFSWMRSFLWGDEPIVDRITSTTPEEIDESSITTQNNSFSTKQFSPQPSEKKTADQFINNKNAYNLGSHRKKELSSEMEENDNYLKEFDRQFDKGFSNFYDTNPHSLIEVEDQWQEKRIKEKCYTNPIYKFLLNTGIDTFLARQPKAHWLSPEEEILLLKRRQLLGNYYDTLALTNRVSTSIALEQLVPKTYANTIYNHQFKGTLKVARRLFSVKKASTVNQSEIAEQKQNKIVKFDQPLFYKEKESKNTQQMLFHEELSVDPEKLSRLEKETQSSLDNRNSNFSTKGLPNEIFTNQLTVNFSDFGYVNMKDKRSSFSLEQADSIPLYAGWDEQLRKFVLTNRYQNRTLAGYTFSENPERFLMDSTNKKTTVFTTWPLPNPLLKNTTNLDINDINFSSSTVNQLGDEKLMNNNQVDNQSHTNYSLNTKDHFKEQQPTLSNENDLLLSHAKVNLSKANNRQNQSKKSMKAKDNKEMSQDPEKFSESENNNKKFTATNSFLFNSKPVTNDMVNALLQWQKVIKENKQQSNEDRQVAKKKVSYWPANIGRATWSNELIENDIELDEPTENILKKKTILWEFIPPYHGGFVWSGNY